MISFSKWGGVAGGAYLLFVAALLYYATHCIGGFCGLMALLAELPWLYFWQLFGGDIYEVDKLSFVFIALNVVVLYLLFAWIEKRVKRNK